MIAAVDSCSSKLLKYYNISSETCTVATILDPRFKLEYYEDPDKDPIENETELKVLSFMIIFS